MWFVSISRKNDLLARFRLPPEGLIVGNGPKCDVLLPGVDEAIRLVPSRHEVWLEFKNGKTESLTTDRSFDLGGVEIRVDQTIPPTPEPGDEKPLRTKAMMYNPQRQMLQVVNSVLEITEGPDAPRRVELEDRTYLIGHLAGCDLVLSDGFVSGRHMRLARREEGWVVTDLDSRNGVLLDGVKVGEAVWRGDSVLRLGKTSMVLRQETTQEQLAPDSVTDFGGMLGRCEAMRSIFALIQRVADVDVTVLVSGPTGSGKELVARALHAKSLRAQAPFVALNCGAVVGDLLASELFGHARGAFTGAVLQKQGLFEVARGGSLFLDEIGELPMHLQPTLLRVLEEREIRRVGDHRAIPVDVRVIAATNRDLAAEVAAGRFRQDLFYRLDLIPINLPPLAERQDDVLMLAEHLLAYEAGRMGWRQAPKLADDAKKALMAYAWPGNVRELANVLLRAMALGGERDTISAADLALPAVGGKSLADFADSNLEEIEREAVRRAIKRYPTRQEAASALGIAPSTLYDKINKYDLGGE